MSPQQTKRNEEDLELVIHDLELAGLSLFAARKAFERVGCAPAAAQVEQIRADLAAVLSVVTVHGKGN